jgi:hypothetical protein
VTARVRRLPTAARRASKAAGEMGANPQIVAVRAPVLPRPRLQANRPEMPMPRPATRLPWRSPRLGAPRPSLPLRPSAVTSHARGAGSYHTSKYEPPCARRGLVAPAAFTARGPGHASPHRAPGSTTAGRSSRLGASPGQSDQAPRHRRPQLRSWATRKWRSAAGMYRPVTSVRGAAALAVPPTDQASVHPRGGYPALTRCPAPPATPPGGRPTDQVQRIFAASPN